MSTVNSTSTNRFSPQYPQVNDTIVTPVASRTKPGQAVAYIGKQICFFELDSPTPPIGVPVKVMLTRVLYRKNQATGHYDQSQVMSILIRPVTDDYAIIAHDGFEISGSMCQTTATSIDHFDFSGNPTNNWRDKRMTITPGRTSVHVTDNIQAEYANKVSRAYGDGSKIQPLQPLRPSWVYVSRELMRRTNVVRAEGLMQAEDAAYFEYLVK